MACLKTGFWGFVKPHGYYIYGDAYAYGHPDIELFTFRVCWRDTREPMNFTPDFEIMDYHDWWDADQTGKGGFHSTMVCPKDKVLMTDRLINYLKGSVG